MNSFEKNLIEFGQTNNTSDLIALQEDIDSKFLEDFIHNRVTSTNFIQIWDYLLKSFGDSNELRKKKYNVIINVLKEIENVDITASLSTSILTRLCMEFSKFQAKELLALCNFCIESIQQGNAKPSWKFVLPDVLNLLMNESTVHVNEEEMTGLEYKSNFINSLCMLQWSTNIVINMASMLGDVFLTEEEHTRVVNKLVQYVDEISPQELPILVYHVVKICANKNIRSLFLKLQSYFTGHIYNQQIFNGESNSESSSMDMIEKASGFDAIEAENTILFHVHKTANDGSDCIKDYLTLLKTVTKAPELILNPFQLNLILTLSTVPVLEERAFEILRLSIVRTIHEDNKRNGSYWVNSIANSSMKVEELFRKLVLFSLEHQRDLVIEGLINFAYILLDVGPVLGREGDPIAEKQWKLAMSIIFRILGRKNRSASAVISSLGIRIMSGGNITQYIECLSLLTTKMRLIMLENVNNILEIMENLVQVPGVIAIKMIDAFLPLVKVSSNVRDRLIMLLRKCLYSRIPKTKQMAVFGFLKLVQNVKIANLRSCSQSSSSSLSSSHSLLTQLSLSCTGRPTNTLTNEAICLEILAILKRCLIQEYDVKMLFYEGLYSTVCLNFEASDPILELLWGHINNFYEENEDVVPPLKVSEITGIKDVTVFLQEPLGKLLYCSGLIALKVLEIEEDNAVALKIKEALESVCNRMTKTELIHFGLDDGTNLTDILPESQKKLLILKELISVYEGLIGFKIMSWKLESENIGQQVNTLFQGYTRLVDFAKNISKPKKGNPKKKKDLTNKTVEESQTDFNDSNVKMLQKFKIPDSLLNIRVVERMLSLLYRPVDYANPTETNVIKTKVDIHRYLINVLVQLLEKWKKSTDLNYTFHDHKSLRSIARILFEACICKMNKFIDFDGTTAVLVAESFNMILNVIINGHKKNTSSTLNYIVGNSEENTFEDALKTIIGYHQEMCNLLDEDATIDDGEIKKLPIIAINTLNSLLILIPITSDLSNEILKWTNNIMETKDLHNKQFVTQFISFVLNAELKFKDDLSSIESYTLKVSEEIGTISTVNQNVVNFPLINNFTSTTVFQCISNTIKTVLDDLDWIISRMRAEYELIKCGQRDGEKSDQIKIKENAVCTHLAAVINITGIVVNISLPSGNLLETVLKNICHLYNTLNTLTKYFIMRSSKTDRAFEAARFQQVLKSGGKHLSNTVNDFVIHFDERQKQDIGTQSKKKTVNSSNLKSKILRETRLIPKIVYEIEQFGKSVMMLSNKTGADLVKYVGPGATRDFRIKGLTNVVEQTGGYVENSQSTTVTENGNDESLVLENSDSNREDSDVSPQPAKRAKI